MRTLEGDDATDVELHYCGRRRGVGDGRGRG